MEREEARVLHLLLRPTEFEEVVRCLQPLLHLDIVLDDNAVEDSINRPHALHLVVVLQCAKHSASQGGEVVINVITAIFGDIFRHLLPLLILTVLLHNVAC